MDPMCSELPVQVGCKGDLVSVRFGGEDEFALFVPGSAEVVLCNAPEWIAMSAPNGPEESLAKLDGTSELSILFQGLGVSIS